MGSSQYQWNNFVLQKYSLKTSRLYFRKYAYKVSVNVENGFYIRAAKKYSLDELSNFLIIKKSAISQGHGVWPRSSTIVQDNSVELHAIGQFVVTNKIKHRIEGSSIDLYTETPQELVNILNFFKPLTTAKISKIYSPDANAPALTPSIILVKTPPKFKYKVFIADKAYSAEKKTQLLNYLRNYPNDVYIPESLKLKLEANATRWLHSMYYYVNDDQVFTFLHMISSDFAKKIYTLVHSA